ncbi:aspartate aminotransferase family protein [Nitrospirillum sp. BR 11163]|uniref:aspartate aminotransferase family protein n=1 Tax=Nitrospirillum sp. BR 11163 TaxID=3104323 RepID=UPI002AFE33F7|nr:aspartate aminotransferase family protein [Nitrospirillum sp. BR 11163]MEA1672742.1 aspartate aminotransferase family protein [Nitrospirillum sp. BR 11163]
MLEDVAGGPPLRSNEADLSSFWMPFTNNRFFKKNPRLLASASGMTYRTPDGAEILDGTAGLWCVNAGHARAEIVDAIARQAATLDFAPTFQLAHPQAFELASRLSAIMPAGLDRIFFTNSGSESADTSLKIALAYHLARGQGGRNRLIGRARGYHGTNFGGMAVGGIGGNRKGFQTQLPGVDHLSHTYRPADAFTRGQPAGGAAMADELEALIALHGAHTIAAVIVEPVAGSTGVLVPPVGYLERLREITRAHGILLIFDEVITGFGRVGAATASERFGVTPDLLNMAKGITNGTVPMGAVAVSRDVHDTIVNSAEPGIELFHGYTYSAHPVATAAALATLEIYERDGLFAHARALEDHWETAAHSLRGAPHVIDVRNFGLMAGIELAPRPGAPGARAMEVFHRCFDEGVLVRVTGDIIALSPPLIVTPAQIARIFEQIGKVLADVA